ncbi:MAG TPA: hypothetical protein VHU41_19020, partial [Thermoanaerobaculia bacterium]|nr:hypothetical protein [Thermoanaerobaculia bacterium]
MLGATHVWTGATDDHFSNAANWSGGSPAGDPAAAISFPASSRLTATNDLNGLTVQSIAFSAGGFTISGNPITLAANATVTDTSQGVNEISSNIALGGNISILVSINNNQAPQDLTLSGAISGAGAVTLRGGGNLVYAGQQPNSYSGLTLVLFGALRLQKAANTTAIAGELDVEDDGATNETGRVVIATDEQIADTSHVTIGRYATFTCSATETIGPLMLFRGAQFVTTGTVVLAGDIEIAGASGGDIVMRGTFLLDGIRTINAIAGVGQFVMTAGQKSPGSGVIVTGGTYSDGSFSTTANLTGSYDGPTTIQGGIVRIDAPQSAVDLQNGGFGGR